MHKPALGILGGTFDPIHLGHLHAALCVLKAVPLIQEVTFVPCYIPVHRSKTIATAEQRWTMLERAIQYYPQLSADPREILRQEPSYMIDTLMSFRQDLPNTPLCLLLGSDTYQTLPNWKNWQELLDYAHIIVIKRPSHELIQHPHPSLVDHTTNQSQDLLSKHNGKILFLNIPPSSISATQIRDCIKQGEDITSMVPPLVAEYIYEQGLYL